jgi:uncharacterized membrane protein YkvA (DUF1232 family)
MISIWRRFRHFIVTCFFILNDERTPKYLKFMPLVLFLLYLIMPLDALPDVIPGIGFIDDSLMAPFLLYLISLLVPDRVRIDNEKKATTTLNEWQRTFRIVMISLGIVLLLGMVGLAIWWLMK